jgi:hypothetical protein
MTRGENSRLRLYSCYIEYLLRFSRDVPNRLVDRWQSGSVPKSWCRETMEIGNRVRFTNPSGRVLESLSVTSGIIRCTTVVVQSRILMLHRIPIPTTTSEFLVRDLNQDPAIARQTWCAIVCDLQYDVQQLAHGHRHLGPQINRAHLRWW